MPPCRINAKPSKKPISHRVLSPATRAFIRMYKAVVAGLTYPVEHPIPEAPREDNLHPVNRYRAYAPMPPTSAHPAFRQCEGQHSEHAQLLRSHSPNSSIGSRTASEISEIDKETKPDFPEHWDADDFPTSQSVAGTALQREVSCQSDLTIEEQVQFAQAVPIKRAVRTSFYPPPRSGSKLNMRVLAEA